MKIAITYILFLSALMVNAQEKTADPKTQIVEVACGQCQFGMKAKGCDLAVRIQGKTYFVDGANIDDYGDAHAEDGFCNAIKKAEVSGILVDNRFKVASLILLPKKK